MSSLAQFIPGSLGGVTRITEDFTYPDPTFDVQQITPTGNPDYYGFGNGLSLNDFFPDYSLYIAKRGASHYLDGGYWFGMIYNHRTDTWGSPFTIKDTSPTYLSGVSAGIVGNHIIIHGSQYTVSGAVDTFTNIGYIQSVDLTTISVSDLSNLSSWGSYTTLPAATFPRYEAYGKILTSNDPNVGYSMWFEHQSGVTWRVNIRKFTDDGSGNLTVTNTNIYEGTTTLSEPQPVWCGGNNWLILMRQNGSGSSGKRLWLFKSTDDMASATSVGLTNLGTGSGACIVDAIFIESKIHVYYHDRGDGYIYRSMDNTFAAVSASATAFNNEAQYYLNEGTGSVSGPGYPSVWLIRGTDIVFETWIKEISDTECQVFGTLNQL
jgi:hypothetical protein